VDAVGGRNQKETMACFIGGLWGGAKAEVRRRETGVTSMCESGETRQAGGWIRRAYPMQGKAVFADHVMWSVPEMEEPPVNFLEEVVWWKGVETDMRKEKTPFLVLRNRVLTMNKGEEADVARGQELLDSLRRRDSEPVKRVGEIRQKWPKEGIDESKVEGNGTHSPFMDVMRAATDAESKDYVALAVQTDAKYYGGNLQDMNRIRAASKLPIICTEIINQPYQVRIFLLA